MKPIFKKGAKDEAASYKPMNFTCFTCILIETIVRNTMNDYLDDNEIIKFSAAWF